MVNVDEAKLEQILIKMRSASIEFRLEAIKEAQRIRDGLFSNCDTVDDFAKAALITEQLYSLTCEALRQPKKRIRVVVDEESTTTPQIQKLEKPKTEKRGKKKIPQTQVDFSALAEGFKALLEKKNETETST